MLNRFAKCDSLESLYLAFEENTNIDYTNLTNDETITLIEVFNSNVDTREQVDDTLNEIAFDYIYNYVIDKEEKDMDNINVTINKVEESEVTMETNNTNTNVAVEDLMNKFKKATKNASIKAGQTYEEFVNDADESINIMKEELGNAVGLLDRIFGYSTIKNSILDMIDASMSGANSKKDIFKMAKRCRELIDVEIKDLEFWGDQDSLKKAAQLKPLTEGARGKSIFEAFAASVVWVIKKVIRKLSINNESEKKSLFASVCNGIGAFAKILRAGVKIAWNVVKYAASFVVSGIVIVSSWIYQAIKTAVSKIKSWITKKDEIIEVELDDFDDDEEEADGVFGTNLA